MYLDSNWVEDYNERKRTCNITFGEPVVIMNGWYRKKLGNLETYAKTGKKTELAIEITDNRFGRIMSCIQHPQVVVRIATWLGVIGMLLGVVGVLGLFK